MRSLEWNTRTLPERSAVYGVGRDMTERRRVEADLSEARRRLQTGRDELRLLVEEQAALRRVATLVARETDPDAVFAAVAREVGEVLGVDATHLGRYDGDGTVVSVAQWGTYAGVPIGARYPLEGDSVSARVLRTGRPARMDKYEQAPGVIAATVRDLGIRSSIGVPVSVEGTPWGVMIATTKAQRPFPEETEARLQDFTELVAAAISNASAHEKLRALADEQAALRRVATLVAEDVPDGELFAAVVDEVGRLFRSDLAGMLRFESDDTVTVKGVWREEGERPVVEGRWSLEGDRVVTAIARTGRPAREDTWGDVTGPIAEYLHGQLGIVSSVGSPIVVEGRVWGALFVHSDETALPANTEGRLLDFTELVATAISNAQARADVETLATEQAALRRVATLVAREASEGNVFGTVTEEAAAVVGTEAVGLLRFEPDDTATLVAQSQTPWDPPPLGTSFPLDGENLVVALHRTGEAVRVDSWANASGSVAAMADTLGVRSSVATPVVVEGRLWGTMIATTSQSEPLPAETETRIGRFSDLIATAIANTEARANVERLAREQAALRRVATLVAQAVSPDELFGAATQEAGELLGGDLAGMIRYNDDGTVTPVAVWAAVGDRPPLPNARPREDGDLATMVVEAGGPVRVDDWQRVPGPMMVLFRELGIRSSVACPITVDGRLWGALAIHSQGDRPLPVGTESRLASFTELVATAMSNAKARGEVERLASEQAALRRVATLVAEGASSSAVLDAVAAEMEALLDADQVALNRYEPDEEIVVLAHRGLDVDRTPVGSRVTTEGDSATATVRRTGRPARMENYEDAAGALGELARATGLRSSVSTPIFVEGHLWGLITASWKGEDPPPADTEERMARFARLLDTAIANAEARAELMASRARLVTASDEARRRFERDLHDGVQQQLVSLSLELRGAAELAPPGHEELAGKLGDVADGLTKALDDLRELSRGIHPAILSRGGLVPALKALARRSAVPAEVHVGVEERLPERVEVAAYYVASEAMTNVAKHAQASHARVRAHVSGQTLVLTIDDDGIGGAAPAQGSGLTGLADRVEALGGSIAVSSPPGGGTSLRVQLPLDGQ